LRQCIVISDILQGNVATRFRSGRTVDYDYYKFTA